MRPNLEATLAIVRRMPASTCSEIADRRNISRHNTGILLRKLRDDEHLIRSIGTKSATRWVAVEHLEAYLATPEAAERAANYAKRRPRKRVADARPQRPAPIAEPVVRRQHIPPAPMSVFNLGGQA